MIANPHKSGKSLVRTTLGDRKLHEKKKNRHRVQSHTLPFVRILSSALIQNVHHWDTHILRRPWSHTHTSTFSRGTDPHINAHKTSVQKYKTTPPCDLRCLFFTRRVSLLLQISKKTSCLRSENSPYQRKNASGDTVQANTNGSVLIRVEDEQGIGVATCQRFLHIIRRKREARVKSGEVSMSMCTHVTPQIQRKGEREAHR